MKLNIRLTEEATCSTKKSRFFKTKLQTNRVTEVDPEVGKEAYWELGFVKHDNTIGDWVELTTHMVFLERMLEQLPYMPGGDLIEPNQQFDKNFVPLKPRDRKFKEDFLGSLSGFVRVASRLPAECRFSPAMEVFIECCRDFNVQECIQTTDSLHLRDRRLFSPQIRCLNDFYRKLKERVSSPAIRKKVREQTREIEVNSERFQSYVDSMFNACARLVVLRLDLEYSTKNRPNLNEAMSDLGRFFSNQRHNKLFRALCGYIVKVEFGISNGYHFHVMLFFDGSKRSNYSDGYLAKHIGEYWVNVITRGKGRYWNANGDKGRYLKIGRLGIGAIHADDSSCIANLKGIVRYFCKKDQFFRPVNNPKFKAIRKGRTPDSSGKKLGRPRTHVTQ